MKRLPRGAFTLVNVLVVIAIIGILIALLLPAVQNAREAARRRSCQNNLLQLGLALQLHHQAHGRLPAGVTDAAGPIRHLPQGQHYGWIAQLLPYLEQGNAHGQIDWTAGVYDKKNLSVRGLELSVLACPSNRTGGKASDYAGCHHDLVAPIDADNHGVLFLNSAITYDQITDGRGYTLFVGEKLTELNADTGMPEFVEGIGFLDGTAAAGEGAIEIPSEPPLEEPRDIFTQLSTLRESDFGWMSGTRATLRNTGTPINHLKSQRNLPVQFEVPTDESEAKALLETRRLHVGGYESNHSGGAQFSFGDGSVRFLNENISEKVYRQLGHRADGAVMGEEAF